MTLRFSFLAFVLFAGSLAWSGPIDWDGFGETKNSIPVAVSATKDAAKRDVNPQVTQPKKTEEVLVVEITGENYEAEVLQSKLPVFLDYGADWCGWCRIAKPAVEELAKEYTGRVKFGSVDTDKQRTLAAVLNGGIPEFIFIRNGKEIPNSRLVGAPVDNTAASASIMRQEIKRNLKALIEKYLLTDPSSSTKK
ncbi:MAG: hypothetical protein HY399_08950 [Elusimicrobia bacterium]|nr:hypothetical protein [Elusimicrobiota bacterium]